MSHEKNTSDHKNHMNQKKGKESSICNLTVKKKTVISLL